MLRRGRHTKLNRVALTPRKGKDYTEVVFFGDLHLGHPTCLIDKAKDMLDYCLKNGVYVHLMGDLLECGLTTSVGDSVYHQKLNPQEQMDAVIGLLQPLADAKLITGLHGGNHEARIQKVTSINVAKIIAGTLGVSYLHEACWNLFTVGKQHYKMYSLHGSSGSRFIYTKLKAITDISHYFDADLICHAHVHDLATVALERQRIDMRSKTIGYYKQYLLLTGHYLGYDLSYAQSKGMPPSKIGSPKVKFGSKEKMIHISL